MYMCVPVLAAKLTTLAVVSVPSGFLTWISSSVTTFSGKAYQWVRPSASRISNRVSLDVAGGAGGSEKTTGLKALPSMSGAFWLRAFRAVATLAGRGIAAGLRAG